MMDETRDVVRTARLPALLTGGALVALALMLTVTPLIADADASPESTIVQRAVPIFAAAAVAAYLGWIGLSVLLAGAMRAPFVGADAGRFHRFLALAPMRTSIDIAEVGDIGLRGVWIILVDGARPQGKLLTGLFGAKGLWIPGYLAEGGGAAVIALIDRHRADLVNPLRD
ncbi:MAG: hypothetical protein KDI98_07325 [Hyphomicrobiaceae bacterium]|nr:hypothetical protein [Hyphomicrobiaceae bacterium]